MHQDWEIERSEEEYIYIQIQLTHLPIGKREIPDCHRVFEVASQVEMASFLVSVVWVGLVGLPLCLCISSVYADPVLCNVGMQGSRPCFFTIQRLVVVYRSYHLSGPRILISQLSVISDVSARLLDFVLDFLHCGVHTPPIHHLGHIPDEIQLWQFYLYMTVLPCHSTTNIEYVRWISYCI